MAMGQPSISDTSFQPDTPVYILYDSAFTALTLAQLSQLNAVMDQGKTQLVLIATPDTSDLALSTVLQTAVGQPASALSVSRSGTLPTGTSMNVADVSDVADILACLMTGVDTLPAGSAIQTFITSSGAAAPVVTSAANPSKIAGIQFTNGNRRVTLIGYSKSKILVYRL